MDPATEPSPVVEFGRFTLDRYRREFLADGRSVDLGAGVRCGGQASRGGEGPVSYNVFASTAQRILRAPTRDAPPADDDGGHEKSSVVGNVPSADVQRELWLGETR